jgi:transcriptional regulator with GAF, ATPase, and Fis domain
MQSCLSRSDQLLAVLIEAEQQISAVENSDAYTLYDRLYRIAQKMVPTDAFYVAQYSASDQTLFFPFNVDNDIYDEPLTIPIGHGPTSWVVRHGKAFILQGENVQIQNGNINFGNLQQVSQSAVHVPMRIFSESGEIIVGVISSQSYQANAYDDAAVRTLQWLADRAATALYHQQTVAQWRDRAQAAEARVAQWQPQAVALSHEFVQLLKVISHKADTLQAFVRSKVGRGTPATSSEHDKIWNEKIAQAVDDLCRECKRIQTQVNLLPLQCRIPAENMTTPVATTAETTTATQSLSPREYEIMLLT